MPLALAGKGADLPPHEKLVREAPDTCDLPVFELGEVKAGDGEFFAVHGAPGDIYDLSIQPPGGRGCLP